MRRSISLEHLHKDKRRKLQMGMKHCRFASYSFDQIKVAGQERILESA
jgi:hypothetical protein